ncbi:cyclic nucleotide-binding domain-containing protein [bacterium]|nr:cyclic nucleotide-binding domain-containing protein [bacterium]
MDLKLNKELIELMKDIPMFQELNEEELSGIALKLDEEKYDPGAELFREGDPGGKLFIIADGSVEIEKSRSHGSGRIVIARFERGGVIGEMSLVDGMTRSASVISVQKTRVYVLTHKSFDEITENTPRLAVKMLRGMTSLLSLRLRNTSGWFADVF